MGKKMDRLLQRLFPRWVPYAYYVNGKRVTRKEFNEMERLYNLWQEPFNGVIQYPAYKWRWWDKYLDKIDPTLR